MDYNQGVFHVDRPLTGTGITPYLADVKLQFPDVPLHRADLLLKRAERKRDVRNDFLNVSLGDRADRKSPIFLPLQHPTPSPAAYLVQVVVESLKEKRHS